VKLAIYASLVELGTVRGMIVHTAGIPTRGAALVEVVQTWTEKLTRLVPTDP